MDVRGHSRVAALFSLLARGRLSITADDLPFTFERLNWRKRAAILRAGVQKLVRPPFRLAAPIILQVEPTNTCNLKCPVCATGAGLQTRPPAMLPFDTFARVVDQVEKDACIVFFWSWGEPFLHPDACRMIRYATDRGLVVHSTTNGQLLADPARAREIVASGLASLVFAVDGLDENTYAVYRRGGSLETVVEAIRQVVRARRAAGTDRPFLTLRFLVMKHNEHQAGQIEAFARELGMDAVTWRRPILERQSVRLAEALGASRGPFAPPSSPGIARSAAPASFCNRPLSTLTVFSGGEVVFCENDFNARHALGSVRESSIADILSGEKTRHLLADFRLDGGGPPFCAECEFRLSAGRSYNVRTVLFGDAPRA